MENLHRKLNINNTTLQFLKKFYLSFALIISKEHQMISDILYQNITHYKKAKLSLTEVV